MTVEEIEKAREAWQTLILSRRELERLEDIVPRPPKMRAYWKLQERERLYEMHQRAIRNCKEVIRDSELVIDPVIRWAEACPDDIKQIVRLYVLELMPWSEISLKVCGDGAPSTARNRLVRHINDADPIDRTE